MRAKELVSKITLRKLLLQVNKTPLQTAHILENKELLDVIFAEETIDQLVIMVAKNTPQAEEPQISM